MNWFIFIFQLSIVYFVFGFLWKWIVGLPFSLLLVAIGIESVYPANILNIMGNYFLAAFTAAYSIQSHSIFIFILGAIFLLFQGFLNIGQKSKEARDQGDYELENSLIYSFFALLFGLVMYIIIYFIPSIGINKFTIWFSHSINSIATMPILKYVVYLIGFINALYIILAGIIAMLGLINKILSIRSEHNASA